MKRWQKRYRGKLYTVSPRRLGIEPRTKSASRDVANEWWEKKKNPSSQAKYFARLGYEEGIEDALRVVEEEDKRKTVVNRIRRELR